MKKYLLALAALSFLAGPASAANKEPSSAAQAVKEAAAAEAAAVAENSDGADAAEEVAVADGAGAAEDVEAAAIADASEVNSEYKTKLICKREKPIGSKRIRKTCYTRAQLDEQSRRTQDAMHRRSQRSGCPDCGGSDGGG